MVIIFLITCDVDGLIEGGKLYRCAVTIGTFSSIIFCNHLYHCFTSSSILLKQYGMNGYSDMYMFICSQLVFVKANIFLGDGLVGLNSNENTVSNELWSEHFFPDVEKLVSISLSMHECSTVSGSWVRKMSRYFPFLFGSAW